MDYIKNFGKFLKKGDVDKLTTKNSVIFVIFGLLYLFSYIFLHNYKSFAVGSMFLSGFLLFAFYFRWIRTNGGKTNFYVTNVIASLVALVGAVLLFIAMFGNLDFDSDALAALGTLVSTFVLLATSIYLCSVFVLRKKLNAKIYKRSKINEYAFYVVLGLGALVLLLNTFSQLSDAIDAGEAILSICNCAIMAYAGYVVMKYVYLYQEHKTGKSTKNCLNCGLVCEMTTEVCPQCGGKDFKFKEKNVFAEIEEFHKGRKKIELSKVFQVDNLPNASVGTKIKAYARIGMKFMVVILFFAIIGSFVVAGTVVDMNYMTVSIFGNSSVSIDVFPALALYLFTLLCYYVGIIVFYIIIYFNFLVLTGFGAIVEDVNGIKNKN